MHAMTIHRIPTPQEVLALLQQNGSMPASKEAFVKAFSDLYPTLNETERKHLLDALLEYVDSLLAKPAAVTA